jgi:hypothetical protein
MVRPRTSILSHLTEDAPALGGTKRENEPYPTPVPLCHRQVRRPPGRHGSAEANTANERLVAEWLVNGLTLPRSAPTGPTHNEVVLAFLRYA